MHIFSYDFNIVVVTCVKNHLFLAYIKEMYTNFPLTQRRKKRFHQKHRP